MNKLTFELSYQATHYGYGRVLRKLHMFSQSLSIPGEGSICSALRFLRTPKKERDHMGCSSLSLCLSALSVTFIEAYYLPPPTHSFSFHKPTVTTCNSSSSARSLIHGLPLRLLHRHPAATGRLRRQPPRPHQARRLHGPLLPRPRDLLRGLLRLPPAAPRPALPPLASLSAFRHQDQAPRRQVLHPPPQLTPRRRSHLRRLPRRLGGQARGQGARQLLPCLPQGLHRQVGGHWPAHLPSVPSSAVAQRKRRGGGGGGAGGGGGGGRCRVC